MVEGVWMEKKTSPRLASTSECRLGKTRVFSNTSASIARSLVIYNSDRAAFPVCSGVVSRRQGGRSGSGVLRVAAIGSKNQASHAAVPGPVQALRDLFPHQSV